MENFIRDLKSIKKIQIKMLEMKNATTGIDNNK